MPNLFMCVMGCQRDQKNGCVDWFRRTLGASLVPYRIFLGAGCVDYNQDEVVLPVDDSYPRLAWKVQSAFKWVLEQPEHFTHIFKTDCDCRIWQDRLLVSGFENHDYVGNFFNGKNNPAAQPGNYAAGAGYVLSRSAAERVASADVSSNVEPITMWKHDRVWCEDMFVGNVVSPYENRRVHSEQYAPNFQGRNYNGPTDNLIVLGNVFDNKQGQ